jgi:hypothetical protein
MNGHALTLLTNTHPVSKTFSLEVGQLQKEPGRGVSFGIARKIWLGGISELAALIQTLKSSQCLQCGVFEQDVTGIVSQRIAKQMQADPGYDARTRAYFGDLPIQTRTGKYIEWTDGLGWMVIDVDFVLSDDDIHKALARFAPELADAPHLIADSASSYIYDSDGRQYRGEGGKHVYFPVKCGADAPWALAILDRLAVARGYARYRWSEHGIILARSIVDTAMAVRSQIDYAAGAICVPPLEQRRPEPRLYNPDAEAVDLREILHELDAEEEAAWQRADQAERERLWQNPPPGAKRRQEREERAVQAKEAQTSDQAPGQGTGAGHGGGYAKGECLKGDTMVEVVGLGTFSWWHITHHFEKFDGRQCLDPFRADAAKDAKIHLINGKKGIASFSHGGTWHYSQRVLTPPADEVEKPAQPAGPRRGGVLPVNAVGLLHRPRCDEEEAKKPEEDEPLEMEIPELEPEEPAPVSGAGPGAPGA